MEAEALNCPNCGAAVASDHTQCEFCKTRLKTMACPSCFGLMFIGSKFCDHCGAIATPVEVSLDGDEGDCPRCRKKLETMKVAATTIRGCEACDGLWMDVATFEHVCADREEQSAVLGFLEKQTSAEVLTKAICEAAKGNKFFSHSISKRLRDIQSRPHHSSSATHKAKRPELTSRESEVLQLVAEGAANKQVAAGLGISIKTVEKHRQHLMDKLGIHDTAGLTRYAIAAGVIEGGAQLTIV